MQIETKVNLISNELIDQALDYSSYLDLVNELFENGKSTGPNQSDDLLNYSKMNIQRMKRLNKTISIIPEMEAAIQKWNSMPTKKMTWLVITEGWCGDAAQNLPAISKLAEAIDAVELKFILRDENLEIMDQFLTNGGRSIPKLIALDQKDLTVLGTWGPRPAFAQEMSKTARESASFNYEAFNKTLQLWYTKDKTQHLQKEFIELIENWL